jgi:ACR3 family arsenite efflux pump ArsB
MHRFNLVFRKYILLWALLAMVVGYLAGKFNHARINACSFLLTPFAFFMMFIMVFPSSLASLLNLKRYAVPIGASFVLFLAAPFVAYTVSAAIPNPFHYLGTGIIISAMVPPNAMLSAWTAFLEGDVLLSFIIQSFSALAGLLFMPFGARILFQDLPSFSLVLLLRNLFLLVVIPFVLGAVVRKVFRQYLTDDLMKKVKPTLSSLSGIIELFIIMISVGLKADDISEYPVIILWGVLTAALYHLASFVISLSGVKLFRFSYENAVPLVYQNGTKNLSVAMVIAITSFESRSALGVAACILVQFPISALFYSLISRHSAFLMNREMDGASGGGDRGRRTIRS